MSTQEYIGWINFLAKNPQGDIRTQYLLAQLCSIITNFANGFGKKKVKQFAPIDFAPWLNQLAEDDEEQKQITENKSKVAELRAKLRAKFGR